jgi:hypothetical protein
LVSFESQDGIIPPLLDFLKQQLCRDGDFALPRENPVGWFTV